MPPKSYERELGAVQQKLEHLSQGQRDIAETSKLHREDMGKKLENIEASLALITRRFDHMDGAWKATTVIATCCGIAGGFAWKAAAYIFSFPAK